MNPSIQIQRLTQLLHQRPPLQFSPQQVFQLHSKLITTGLHSHHSSSLLSLLELYFSNPSTISQATALFHLVQEPNTTLKWRLIIRSHASSTNPIKALSLFQELLSVRNCNTNPVDDPFIYASVIKACHKLQAFREGKSVHCYVLRVGLDYNVYILNSLVRFYLASVDLMCYASQLFDRIPEKTVASVNSMVSGWFDRGNFDVGSSLFQKMLRGCFGFSVEPNSVTFVILVSGCIEFERFEIGKSLHAHCCKMGLNCFVEVCNVLIDLYAKFNFIHDAESVFGDMPDKDLFSWNTMISGYAKTNYSRKAYLLFKEMKDHKMRVDRITFISLISASTSNRDLIMGRMIHGHLRASGMEISVSICNALINMYSKCGAAETARRVFDDLPDKDIVSWNSIIHGYVECGLGVEALKLFDQMQLKELKADEVTILGLILACRDTNQLNRGIQLHSYVESNNYLIGSIVLHNALIDMYAKCGSMTQARAVFNKMPSKDVISWTTMIAGHAMNGEGEESLATFQNMLAAKMEPDSITFIGALFACDLEGLVDDGQSLYNMMLQEYHIEPQIEHCGCMVDMLARAGRIEEAYQFARTMPVEPNAVVWRMLINACSVHGHSHMGLGLVKGIRELNMCCSPEDQVVSSKIFAEVGNRNDVLFQTSSMVAERSSKMDGRSLVLYITG